MDFAVSHVWSSSGYDEVKSVVAYWHAGHQAVNWDPAGKGQQGMRSALPPRWGTGARGRVLEERGHGAAGPLVGMVTDMGGGGHAE